MKNHDTERFPPSEITPTQLVRSILRYNFGCGLFGAVVLLLSLGCWIGVFFLAVQTAAFFDPFQKISCLSFLAGKEGESLSILIMVVSMIFLIGGVGLFSYDWFLVVRYDDRFPALHRRIVWEVAPQSIETRIVILICIAPILTCWGLVILKGVLPMDRNGLRQACAMYRHLAEWGDWKPYPRLESQRQAVILLFHLGLVRISRRFGRLEVKLLGAGPKMLGKR